MIRYHELLKRKLDELRTDVHTFFRLAHIYRFGTDPDLSNEVAQYQTSRGHSALRRGVS